ncbi:MAG: histidine--tRNA ligase [Actinomycetota bacterium]|nr:histidine--tRNA ligase [Actinomycetota bacterium]
MARPTPLSGFPEWLPEGRFVEQSVLDTLRRTFELHGFAGIETRAVEPLDQLLRKGETSKEVYVLRRLQADDDGGDSGLGLHFDLTVPFARYVLENSGKLHFPFRRYQIQKVWRGERPQDGRFREFYQADIDVVGSGELAFHHEVEVAVVVAEGFAALAPLGVPPVRFLVNNRALAEGLYRGLGLTDVESVLRCIDKLAKIGPEATAALLRSEAGASDEQAAACLELAAVSAGDGAALSAAVGDVASRNAVPSEAFAEGLERLGALVDAVNAHVPGIATADLSIARGLDYYTGSVFETVLEGHEDLGSICSGGRYDALASDGSTSYPGVGLSFGVSRIVSRLLGAGLVTASRSVPSAVLVAVTHEDGRREAESVASALRGRGIPCEVSPSAAKFGKQIRHADRRGIPFVWFCGADEDGSDQVKDIRSGEQVSAVAEEWTPPAEDLWPRALRA